MPDEVEPMVVHNLVHGDVHGDNLQIGYVGGDFTLHQHAKTRPPAELPLQIGVLPQRVAFFQQRPVSLRHFVTVLSGMGGVGKTQLAADLAQRAWAANAVKLLVWVTASSRDAIVSTYAEVAAELTGRDDLGPERGARRLLEWLARADVPWCVVLDDLQDPADLDGLWPPESGQGRVLVTTRRRDAALLGHGRQVVDVDTFSEAEGLAYLQAVLGGQPSLLHGAAEVVRALGSLPLALAQAGAYMLDRHLSCAEYQRRLRFGKGDADEHQASVAATWALSMEQAELLRPRKVAGVLLDIASVLSPNGIPLDVLTGPAVLDHLASAARCRLDGDGVRDVLAGLHRLSLVTMGSGEVRIHALVQQAHRAKWNAKEEKKVVRAAADVLQDAWPKADDERNDDWGNVLRVNAKALVATGATHLYDKNPHLLPVTLGHSFGFCGFMSEAVAQFDRHYEAAVRSRGQYDFHALAALSHRAQWRIEAGDQAGALADIEHIFAHHHRVRLRDRREMRGIMMIAQSNHADLRARAGDVAGAVAELEQLLPVYQRVYGFDSPDTLAVQHEIATYRSQLDPTGDSVAELEQLLAAQLRTYGPDHILTLGARHNLACARAETGDLSRAIAELEQLVVDSARVLGRDHPKALTARSVLGDARAMAGDRAGALADFERLLADRLRVLGAGHPDVQRTRDSMAYWQRPGN